MKKSLFPNTVMALLALLFCACTTSGFNFSYDSTSQTQYSYADIEPFERVEIIGSPTVYYQQADSFSFCVKGPSEIIDNIIWEVEGNKLVVRNRGKLGFVNVNFGNNRELAVYVTSPDLIGVTLNGSGDFISEHRVDTDSIDIRLKGSGDVHFSDLLCDYCDAELIGSGDLDIKRLDTRKLSATLVGSGDIDIVQKNADETNLSLRGSGDIDVNFESGCGSVSAELQGSGDIVLKGQVQQLNKYKRGSGDIDTDRLKVAIK